MTGETQSIGKTHAVWADALIRDVQPKEKTEQDKFKNGSIFDYANSQVGGAYMG